MNSNTHPQNITQLHQDIAYAEEVFREPPENLTRSEAFGYALTGAICVALPTVPFNAILDHIFETSLFTYLNLALLLIFTLLQYHNNLPGKRYQAQLDQYQYGQNLIKEHPQLRSILRKWRTAQNHGDEPSKLRAEADYLDLMTPLLNTQQHVTTACAK